MFTKLLLLHSNGTIDKDTKSRNPPIFYQLYYNKLYIEQWYNKLLMIVYTYFEITHQYSVLLSKIL